MNFKFWQDKDKKITLYNEDCLLIFDKLLKEGYQGKIDLVVCDPPYKTTGRGNYGNCGGMFKKEIMCNNFNLIKFLNIAEEIGFKFIKSLIWKKDNKIMGAFYMTQFEYILFFRKGKGIKINNCGTSDILEFPNKKIKLKDGTNAHDTEKPVELMKVLIENSSKENEIVLDFAFGIGATAIACKETNRKFIGCEIDEEYFEISKRRLEGKPLED